MKRQDFLKKLIEQKKLTIVEPSEEIKNSYIERSESNLVSAKILFENNRLEESVFLAYYSMYHMITAIFSVIGIKCENHTAAIILLKEIFNLSNKEVFDAKRERIDKRYYPSFHTAKEDVFKTIMTVENFRKRLFDFISKINAETSLNYGNRFKIILGNLN